MMVCLVERYDSWFRLSSKTFYFRELNTRFQVEHPITEKNDFGNLIQRTNQVSFCGLNLSAGKENYYPKLFAMECRINLAKASRSWIQTKPRKKISKSFAYSREPRL